MRQFPQSTAPQQLKTFDFPWAPLQRKGAHGAHGPDPFPSLRQDSNEAVANVLGCCDRELVSHWIMAKPPKSEAMTMPLKV